MDYELYDYRKNIYYVDNNPFMFENTIILITHTKELVEWCDDEKVLEKDECIRGFAEAL